MEPARLKPKRLVEPSRGDAKLRPHEIKTDRSDQLRVNTPTTERGTALGSIGRDPSKSPVLTASPDANVIAARQLAFSRPPAELIELLATEIDRVADFVVSLQDHVTFFGGARVKDTQEHFIRGKEWGEALFLRNLMLANHGLGLRACASGLFSPGAVKAAKGAALGAAAGVFGPLELGKMLGALGSGSDEAIAHALGQLTVARADPSDLHAILALGLSPETGGGPGMMSAVPLGFFEARQKAMRLFPEVPKELFEAVISQGAKMEGPLPFEQKKSQIIEKMEGFFHFISRRLALTARASGFIVFPGGFGTLNEAFEVMRDERPVVFESKQFWQDAIATIEDKWKARGFLNDGKLNGVAVVDDASDGLPVLESQVTPPKDNETLLNELFQLKQDLVEGLTELQHWDEAVTFLGSEALEKDAPEIAVARALSEDIAGKGGAVRASNLGPVFDALEAGVKTHGRKPQVAVYDRDGVDDLDVSKRSEESVVVKSAIAHKPLLYENTKAVVALPGGVDVFDEVFEVACLMTTKNLPKRPLVLVGKDFWAPIIDKLEAVMDPPTDDPEVTRTVSPRDFREYLTIVDTVDEAKAALAAHSEETS